jgi:putative hydrolase of the HAD superfamily
VTLQAVLLDYGHTLVDYARPEAELLEAYHRVNQRLEVELECEVPQAAELLRALSVGIDEVVARSYAEGSEQEVDFGALYDQALAGLGLGVSEATKAWAMLEEQRAWIKGLQPSPHAAPVLQELRGRGLKLCIVSNAAYPAPAMREHLRELGLLPIFDATVYSSEIGIRKPNRAIYDAALQRIGVAPEQAVFVGDRIREDVRGPRAVGIDTVLTHEFRQEDPPPDLEVPVIASLAELPGLIDSRIPAA